MDEGDENTIKILVATDCHVGYMEKDSIRHSDSINTFEEILQLARKNKVDMVLLGGNLFHENTPSKKSLHGVMTLLRKYCMGDRPVQIEFLSDQSVNFAASPFPNVNYEDPNLNIDMPVFSIHGNYDNPRGLGTLSALDMLSVCGLVNYFGKSTSLESVEISPILIQKGTTKLAMFGLGSIRDERLRRMFLSKKISMLRPKQNADSWFNIFVINQNRAKRSRHNCIPEQFLDNFIDLVIWGREHECLIDPVLNATQNFFISQPGSSIATSLSPEEAVPKHVGLLQVRGKAMIKCTKLKLETVRPFYIEDVEDTFQDTTHDPDEVKLTKSIAFCTEKVEALIQKAADEDTGKRRQPTLPLIHLRVDYREWYNKFDRNRFGQNFVGRVANTKDLVQCSKRIIQVQTNEDTEPGEDFNLEALGTERSEDLVCKHFSGIEETKQLELLSDKCLGLAVREYVDNEEKEAIQVLVEHQLSQSQGQLMNGGTTEDRIDDELHRFKEERRQMSVADITEEFKELLKQKGDKRSFDSSKRLAATKQMSAPELSAPPTEIPKIPLKMSAPELSASATEIPKRPLKRKGYKGSFDSSKRIAGKKQMSAPEMPVSPTAKPKIPLKMSAPELSASPTAIPKIPLETKELESVLLHTRRLIVNESPGLMHRREGEKSGQDTVLRGFAELKLNVVKWMSTDDETHLEIRDEQVVYLSDLISILAPLCPAVEHFSINSIRVLVSVSLITPIPKLDMPMKSILTLCIKSVDCDGKLQETLLEINKSFPKAESLDLQVMNLNLSSKEYIPGVNSSSSLKELKLRWTDRFSDDVTTNSLLMDISTSCPNIVSLALSGFGRFLLNKSGIDIKSHKVPHLTNIHLEVIGKDDCCQFAALTNVLHVVHVTSPCLNLVEAEKVQLGDAELASVKWSRTSSGYELLHEGELAVVPMADLMYLVSNELKGVTVLTFDRCKIDIPQSISNAPQNTGEESSLQELKFLNVENLLSQTDIHKLSEIYPNIKVTVAHDSKASHEDSEQGTRMPFKLKRKTSLSSSPTSSFSLPPASSIDELVGATARVQIHEEQTDTQITEEEEKEEEEEDYIAMEILPHETDELFGATSTVQIHEELPDTQIIEEEEEDYNSMETLPHETDEVTVKPIKMECFKRVGVEGGKLKLDSFGIELEIPPGAIDSEAPQDISLSVLTDTPNLGNNKEEVSVCFGVQCLAPDDLVLKLPVTYTIPHCAVINGTRHSSVEAVLYTGEGEYSPDFKERIMLSGSGIPSCIITKDVLKLKMNHFSWAKIKLMIKNFRDFFFRVKRMCCRPFKEKNEALQKTPVILHAHLYDDIEGNSELVKKQEAEEDFAPAHIEQQVLIKVAEVIDLGMTCYIKETVIGRPAVVSFEKLTSGARICEPFELDFTDQPDVVAVSLKVGQIERLQVNFLFRLDFSTPRKKETASPQDPEQLQRVSSSERLQRASSSETLQTSHRSTCETLENISGRQENFDDKLTTVAQKVAKRDEIDNLGKALGFDPEDIQRYVDTNMKNADVSCMGTLSMLRDWNKKQTKGTECKALKSVLMKVNQIRLASELCGSRSSSISSSRSSNSSSSSRDSSDFLLK